MPLLLAVVLFGCAGREWPFRSTRAEPARPVIRYVGVAALPLHREPGGAVVTELERGQKVARSRVEKGWARVRVAATGREGWVENAKLASHPPREPEPAPAADATPAQALPPESPAPPAPKPARGTSVFDPF